MYYEEKIIDGKLHWRNSPNGIWKLVDETELAEKYVELKKQLEWYTYYTHKLETKNQRLRADLKSIMEIGNTLNVDDAIAEALLMASIAEEALKEESYEVLR